VPEVSRCLHHFLGDEPKILFEEGALVGFLSRDRTARKLLDSCVAVGDAPRGAGEDIQCG
jgi:hypothetical protein